MVLRRQQLLARATKKSLRRGKPSTSNVIATLDIGSNATRLRIFRVENNRPQELCRHRFAVQLGAGTFETGRLADAQISALQASLLEAAEIARKWNVDSILAVATSAVRDASNREEFLGRIADATGIQVRVISGAEEAWLMGVGATAGGQSARGAVVIDIGGGSTELVFMDAAGQLAGFTSVDVGAVRLARQWACAAPISAEELAGRVSQVKQVLSDGLQAIGPAFAENRKGGGASETSPVSQEFGSRQASNAIAIGGTPGALSQMLQSGRGAISRAQIQELVQEIAAAAPSNLVSRYSLDANRAELILPGAIILCGCMEMLNLDSITPTDRGVCEGLAADYAGRRSSRG